MDKFIQSPETRLGFSLQNMFANLHLNANVFSNKIVCRKPIFHSNMHMANRQLPQQCPHVLRDPNA